MYARSWWAVKSRINSWAAWSLSMGLLENQKKTQICGRKKQAKQELSLDWPQAWIRSDTKPLVAAPPTSQPRDECGRIVLLLSSALLCFPRCLRLAQENSRIPVLCPE